MVHKLFLFGIILSCLNLAYTQQRWPEIRPNSNPDSKPNYDSWTSAEIEERRTRLEEQLRLLSSRRRHRYDKDKRCCERSLEAEDSVEGSPCCQRLQKQKCPYQEKSRCGVPAQEVRYVDKPIRRNVTRVVSVTQHPPETIRNLEKERIAKLEEDLRMLKITEEERMKNLEAQRRIEFEDSLRREQEDEEGRLIADERDRRMALEEELARLRQAEIDRLLRLSNERRVQLEAKLEAEKREQERQRIKREELLWQQLDADLKIDDERMGQAEQDQRQKLEFELQQDRQNQLLTRKKRYDDRRAQLEFELNEQRQRDIQRLNELEEARRREFAEELRRLGDVYNLKRDEIIQTEEVTYEKVPELYDSVRQNCCYRCAGQNSCGSQGCSDSDDGECPLKKKPCDKCRCNHSFVSCNGN